MIMGVLLVVALHNVAAVKAWLVHVGTHVPPSMDSCA